VGGFRDKLAGPASRLVLPLDVPDRQEALDLVRRLAGLAGVFKIGLELFLSEGPDLVEAVRSADPGAAIFLDLKLHDIPATVGRAMEAINRLSPDLVTIHAQGGLDMMRSASEAAGSGTTVLAVTVLTSLDPADLDELTPEYRRPGLYAARLAQRAIVAGCGGLVASAREVLDLRSRFGPGPLLVIPGIRPQWGRVDADDQRRVGTIASAIAGGADLLVIGRPIRSAPDPAEAAKRVLDEIAQALEGQGG
jgi:orotidine-5'-phosphate decarboxylase